MTKIISLGNMKRLKTGVMNQERYVKIKDLQTGRISIFKQSELTNGKILPDEKFVQFALYMERKTGKYKFMGFCKNKELA